jgi:hypothetical protein
MCRTNEAWREGVTDQLKTIINDASTKSELWTRDWDRHPLPRAGLSSAGGRFTGYGEGSYGAGELSGDSDSEQPGLARGRGSIGFGGKWKGDKGGGGDIIRRGGRPPKKNQQKGVGKKKRLAGWDEDEGEEEEERGGALLTEAERAKRSRRAGRFGDGTAAGGGVAAAAAAAARREKLASMQLAVASAEQTEEEREQTWDALTIKGTNPSLEKSYFRLTSAPDPATVRPQPVLVRALERLQ